MDSFHVASARIAEAHSELKQQRMSSEAKHTAEAVKRGSAKLVFVAYKDGANKKFGGHTVMPVPFTNETTIAGIRRELFNLYGIPICRCYYLATDIPPHGVMADVADLSDGYTLVLEMNRGPPCACRG